MSKAKYFALEILTQYLVTEGTFPIIPREKWGNGGSTSPHSLRVQKYKIEHDVVRLVLRPGTIPVPHGSVVTKAKYFAVDILTQYLVTEGAFSIIPREKWGNGGSTSPHS